MIIEGDCLEVMKTFEDNQFDLVLTDPPYFMPARHYVPARGKFGKKSLADTSILANFFDGFFQQLFRIIKPDAVVYIFCDAQSYPVIYRAIYPYVKYARLLIWDKKVSYNGYTWRHQHELILWGEQESTDRIATGDGDILSCRGVLQKDRHHPAEKPVDLLKKLIAKHPNAKNILDPFAGSGSTLVAAQALNRDFVGIELNEDYVKIAESRLKQEALL